MPNITSVSQTQKIIVNPATKSISLQLAGPMGPAGPPGVPGLTMIPIGAVIDYAGASAPTSFRFLDGSTVVNGQNVYPSLWVIIPAGWKSGADIIFPNAGGRGTIAAGTGVGLTARVLGATGGAETHLLTGGESGTPVHNHSQNSHNHIQDSHNHIQDSHNHTQNAHDHPAQTFTTVGFNTNHYHSESANTGDLGYMRRGTYNGAEWNAQFTNDGLRSVTFHAQTATNWGSHDHSHTVSVNLDPLTATNIAQTATNQLATATNVAATATNVATTAADAATAHNNMQPFLVLNKIIRCE